MTTETNTETKPAAVKAVKEFKSEAQTVLTIKPVDPELYGEQTLTVERGVLTTTKGEEVKAAPRFRVTLNHDKLAKGCEGVAATVDGAIKAYFKASTYGGADDFTMDEAERDSEFFQAKPKDNVDKNDPFAGKDAEQHAADRIAVQELAVAAENAEDGAQAAHFAVADFLWAKFQAFDNKKAFGKWCDGAEGHGAEAPFLVKLNAGGKNAISEAYRAAQLTEMERRCLLVNMLRGKTIDKFIRDAIVGGMDDFARTVQRDEMEENANVEDRFLSTNQILDLLDDMADRIGADVSDDASVTLDNVAESSQGMVEAFESKFGKHDLSEDSRKCAGDAVSTVVLSMQLVELIELSDNVDKILNTKDADAGNIKSHINKLRNHVLHKRVVAAVEARGNAAAKEARLDSLKEEADGGEKLVAKSAEKKFFTTPVAQVAAQLFNTVLAHQSPAEVADAFAALMADWRKEEAASAKAEKADAE